MPRGRAKTATSSKKKVKFAESEETPATQTEATTLSSEKVTPATVAPQVAATVAASSKPTPASPSKKRSLSSSSSSSSTRNDAASQQEVELPPSSPSKKQKTQPTRAPSARARGMKMMEMARVQASSMEVETQSTTVTNTTSATSVTTTTPTAPQSPVRESTQITTTVTSTTILHNPPRSPVREGLHTSSLSHNPPRSPIRESYYAPPRSPVREGYSGPPRSPVRDHLWPPRSPVHAPHSPVQSHTSSKTHVHSHNSTKYLPSHFADLEQLFIAFESAFAYHETRKQICHFEKLQHSVQTLCKRDFLPSHLAQLKTVFPEGYYMKYIFQQATKDYRLVVMRVPCVSDTAPTSLNNSGGSTSGSILVNSSGSVGSTTSTSSSGTTCSSSSSSSGGETTYLARQMDETDLTSSISSEKDIMKRRSEFHNRLVSIVRRFYEDFLARKQRAAPAPLQPKDGTEESEPVPWEQDSEFQLERIPPIPEAPLPQPPPNAPSSPIKSPPSSKFAHRINTNDIIMLSLARAKDSNNNNNNASSNNSTPTNSSQPLTPRRPVARNLLGINSDALEQVRAREAKLKDEAQHAEYYRKRRLQANLPNLCDYIRSFYSIESKSAMPFNDILEKLTTGMGGAYKSEEIREMLHLLVEVVPEWCSIVDINHQSKKLSDSNTDWFKIDRKLTVATVKQRIAGHNFRKTS